MPTKEGVKNINSRCKFACSQLGILKTRDDHVRLYDNLQMYIWFVSKTYMYRSLYIYKFNICIELLHFGQVLFSIG